MTPDHAPRWPALLLLPAVALLVLFWAAPARADRFRCANGIADTGHTPQQVLERCGPPTQKDRWRTLNGTRQQWLYNAGPDRLLTTVTFLNGRVTAIRASGFGFDPERQDRDGCRRGRFRIGEPRASVLARCGEPERRIGGESGNPSGRLPLTVTERFDYRTATQVHEIYFENGRVTQIKSRFR